MKIKTKIIAAVAAIAAVTLCAAAASASNEDNSMTYGVYMGKTDVSKTMDGKEYIDINDSYVAWATISSDGQQSSILPYVPAGDENGVYYDRSTVPASIALYYINDRGYNINGTRIDCIVAESTENYVILNYNGIGIKEDGTEEAVNDYWKVDVSKLFAGSPTFYEPLPGYEVPENAEQFAKVVY